MFQSFFYWTVGMLLKSLLSLAIKLPRKAPVSNDTISNNRLHLAKILRVLFPAASCIYPEKLECLPFRFENVGMILGFNHFSLGEIPRLIMLCFKSYPDRRLFFPVKSDFYQIFQYSKKYLDGLGIELCPIITPHVYKKMIDSTTSAKTKDEIDALRTKYNHYYLNRTASILNENGVVIVAPSATRRRTVFETEEQFLGLKPVPPVFQLIALNFARRFPDRHHLEFIPVPIIPPTGFNRGLNLFRKYYFPATFTPFSLEEAMQNDFDFEFLIYCANKVPRELSYPS